MRKMRKIHDFASSQLMRDRFDYELLLRPDCFFDVFILFKSKGASLRKIFASVRFGKVSKNSS